MPGKAWEAVVWPLSGCGGPEETSLHTSGAPRRALLVPEQGRAGRLACRRAGRLVGVGRQWDEKQQFNKQIIMKLPLDLEIVKDPAPVPRSPVGPGLIPPHTYGVLIHP